MNAVAGLLIPFLLSGAYPHAVWEKVIERGGTEKWHGLDVSSSGDVYVTGENEEKGTSDVWTARFDSTGEIVWERWYDNLKNDAGFDLSFVGSSATVACLNDVDSMPKGFVISYDSSDAFQWITDVGEILGNKPPVIVSASPDTHYVSVCGENDYSPLDCGQTLFMLDGKGKKIHTNHESASLDLCWVTGITITSSGYVVSCASPLSCVALWNDCDVSPMGFNKYNGSKYEHALGVAANKDGFAYVGGEMRNGSWNMMLIKWGELQGDPLWPAKGYDLGADEKCEDIAVDSISDCYLAGWQAWGSEEDAALVKTDSSGSVLWSWVDTVPGLQEIEAIEVDKDGYIYLAGSHHNGTDWDALVMKVRQPLTITGNVTDSLGKVMKNTPVAVSGDTTLEVLTDNNGNYEITIYNGGNYTIRPNLPGYGFEPLQRTYTPLAHREWNQDFDNCHWTAVSEQPVTEPVTFGFDGSTVCFRLPDYEVGIIKIYSVLGSLVKSSEVRGDCALKISDLEAGVYIVELETGNFQITNKFIILK